MSLAARLAAIETRIANACHEAGRARASVQLLAVSKTRSAAEITELAALGLLGFGENYVQEALPKLAALAPLNLEWHHIGPIQSNKTSDIAAHFAWAQGVDRLKLGLRLGSQRPTDMPPLNICVQVNISGEASKSGCAPAEALALCRELVSVPGLRLRGLMALPAPVASADAAAVRAPFRTLRQLFEALRRELPAADTLSMGMSDDFEAAIAEGSTLIRIGTALFGERPAGKSHPESAS